MDALLHIKAWEYAAEQAKKVLDLATDVCKCCFDVVPVDTELLFKGKVFYKDGFIGWVSIDQKVTGELIYKFELNTQ